MRSIAKTDSAEGALAFNKFLSGKGIESRIDREDDSTYRIWIVDDSQFESAADLFKQYREAHAAAAQGSPGFSRYQRMAGAPLSTALVIVSVIVTLLSGFGSDERVTGYLLFDPDLILSGQVWRLVTPIFLHFTIIHLAFDMLWLIDLGWMVERRFGRLYLGILILVAAVISSIAQCWWSGPDFGGMSGVVYGLFGFIWIRSMYDPAPYFGLNRTVVIMMIGWLFLCMTGKLGHIGNAAHAAGLLTGMAWALAARVRFKK
jgi:GlpG protein